MIITTRDEKIDEQCEVGSHVSINHPFHYKGKKMEAINIIEDFNLDFHLGNAIKYILRAGKKNDKIEDLKKAIWYLERECNHVL